jgi:NAD(P)-dependent dehydrogenase (short-subunit alcohol dehydrogenase family)
MRTQQSPIGSGFNERTTAQEVVGGVRLDGKTVLITGGDSGIGLESTRVLAGVGATIVVGAWDSASARAALSRVPGTEVYPLDLADPVSIDTFSSEVLGRHSTIDVLMNNAGIMALPTLTRDRRGYELQFSTNHLGHFQLTARLWRALKDARGARVITLSSYGHWYSPVDFDDIQFERRPYDEWKACGQSKSANALYSVELDGRGEALGIRAFAAHPGRIPSTRLTRSMTPSELVAQPVLRSGTVYVKNVQEGAATQVWAAVSPQLAGRGGVYCADCDISPLVHQDSPLANSVRDYAVDPGAASRLWTLSEKMTGVEFD